MNFYTDSNQTPDIEYISEGFYGVSAIADISLKLAQDLVIELNKFIEEYKDDVGN